MEIDCYMQIFIKNSKLSYSEEYPSSSTLINLRIFSWTYTQMRGTISHILENHGLLCITNNKNCSISE